VSQIDLTRYCVRLFTTFPNNNFCHRFTEHILLSILASFSGERLASFLSQSLILPYLVETEKENRKKTENGLPRALCIPFIYQIGSFIQEKSSQDELIASLLEKELGWDVLMRVIAEDRQKSEQTMGPYDDREDSNSYNPDDTEDPDDEIESDEPNDADDYDTDQAEILLSKAEIEAVA